MQVIRVILQKWLIKEANRCLISATYHKILIRQLRWNLILSTKTTFLPVHVNRHLKIMLIDVELGCVNQRLFRIYVTGIGGVSVAVGLLSIHDFTWVAKLQKATITKNSTVSFWPHDVVLPFQMDSRILVSRICVI